MLNWANQFSILIFLDSNNYPDRYGTYECLLAVDTVGSSATSLEELQEQHAAGSDWMFGHICYDHKNKLEPKLQSAKPANLGFPELQFFRPRIVCFIGRGSNELVIECLDIDPAEIWHQILAAQSLAGDIPSVRFQHRTSKGEYLEAISALRMHIADGDCYEINYCTEAFAESTHIQPLAVFKKLNGLSPAPFAAYYRLADSYLVCSSPERYLRKADQKVICQPIKGTAGRSANAAEDEAAKDELYASIKERAENIMITDLSRNDLARVCETGSVQVDELFGIYSFPRVHQMISTISGSLRKNIPFTDAIRFSFPMGSMTGAPKVKVMQLIEQYEQARRELFSGTVGYIDPEGNFDFNVVIRSLFYNATTQYLSYQSGGAITYDSIAEHEWEEMRLKASAMEQVFA